MLDKTSIGRFFVNNAKYLVKRPKKMYNRNIVKEEELYEGKSSKKISICKKNYRSK